MEKNVKVSVVITQFNNGNIIVQTDNSTFILENAKDASILKILKIAIMEKDGVTTSHHTECHSSSCDGECHETYKDR